MTNYGLGGVTGGLVALAAAPVVAIPVGGAVAAYATWNDAKITRDLKQMDANNAARTERAMTLADERFWNDYADLHLLRDSEFDGVGSLLRAGPFAQNPTGTAELAAKGDVGTPLGRYRQRQAEALADGVITADEQRGIDEETRALMRAEAKRIETALREYRAGHVASLSAQAERDRVLGPLVFGANLISLGGDAQSARIAQGLAQLGAGVYDLISLTRNQIQQDPWRWANVYLGCVTTVVGLLSETSARDNTTVTFQMLREISRQISDLRREMHERFELLNVKIDRYFEYTAIALDNLKRTQESILELQTSLKRDVASLRLALNEGFDETAQISQSKLDARCFAERPDRSPAILGAELANECADGFISYGLGRPKLNRLHEGWNDRGFAILNEVLTAQTDLPPTPNLNPERIPFAVNQIARFVRNQPAWADVVRSRRFYGPQGSYAFSDLVSYVSTVDRVHREMAVEPGKGFRDKVFEALMKRYTATLGPVASEVRKVGQRIRNGWPDPAVSWLSTSPPNRPSPNFERMTIPQCSPKPVLDMRNVRELDFKFPNEVDERRKRLHAFEPERMKVNPLLLAFLPSSVRWAESGRAGAMTPRDFKLEMCFSSFDITRFNMSRLTSDVPGLALTVFLTIDVYVNYVTDAGQPRRLLIERLDGSVAREQAFFDPRWTTSLSAALWNGGSAEVGDGTFVPVLTGRTPDRSGIAANADEWIARRLGQPEDLSPNLKEFEDEFTRRLASTQKSVRDEALVQANEQVRETDAARWALMYWLTEGLDLSEPSARTFVERVSAELLTGEEFVWAVVKNARVAEQLYYNPVVLARASGTLAKDPTLTPAPSRFIRYVDVLRAIEKGSSQP